MLASLREGFGLAVAEGLACGRPVAVSRGAGAAALVREGVTGTLLDPLDVSSIASAIVRGGAAPSRARRCESVAALSLQRETERLAAVLEAAIGAGAEAEGDAGLAARWYSGYVDTLITGVLVAIHMLLAITCITTVLMHSGKDSGLSGAFGVGGFSSTGGTQIMERNLTRVTVVAGILLVCTTIALGFRL